MSIYWGIVSAFIAAWAAYTDFERVVSEKRSLTASPFLSMRVIVFLLCNGAIAFVFFWTSLPPGKQWIESMIAVDTTAEIVLAGAIGVLTPVLLKSSAFYLGGFSIGLDLFYSWFRTWALLGFNNHCDENAERLAKNILETVSDIDQFLLSLHDRIDASMANPYDEEVRHLYFLSIYDVLVVANHIGHVHHSDRQELRKGVNEAMERVLKNRFDVTLRYKQRLLRAMLTHYSIGQTKRHVKGFV